MSTLHLLTEAERFQLQAVRTYLKDWYDAEHSGWDCPPMPDHLDKVLIHVTALLRSTGGVAWARLTVHRDALMTWPSSKQSTNGTSVWGSRSKKHGSRPFTIIPWSFNKEKRMKLFYTPVERLILSINEPSTVVINNTLWSLTWAAWYDLSKKCSFSLTRKELRLYMHASRLLGKWSEKHASRPTVAGSRTRAGGIRLGPSVFQ